MNRTETVALAASALVIGSLVAVAASAVAATVDAFSSWTIFAAPSADPTPATVSPEAVSTNEEETAPTDGEFVLSDGTRLQTIDGETFSARGPGDCTTNAAIHPYGARQPGAKLRGILVDMGASEFAAGAVGYNTDGLIATYTVEPGDSLIAIGERFCVDYVTVGAYNDRFASNTIQPGDVLVLRP